MNVLAIDVSVTGCAVALINKEKNLATSKVLDTDRGQAEMLIPMIDDVVQESNLQMKDIHLIAVTRGPGSFTGVRIGLAAARSLGMALNIPVMGLSTLDVIARSHEDKSALFLIDTKRGDYYGQVGVGGEASIWTEEHVNEFKGAIVKDSVPDVHIMAQMAIEDYREEKVYDISGAPTPIYLREAEISQSKKPSIYKVNL